MDASAVSIGSNADWATLVGTPLFVAFQELAMECRGANPMDYQILELMLRSGLAPIKRFALCEGQKIPPITPELRELEAFLAQGRTHPQDTGPGKKTFDKLHRAFEARLRKALDLEGFDGTLNLPNEEIVKLAKGKYSEVHLEKIVACALEAAGRSAHQNARSEKHRNAIPEMFAVVKEVGACIFGVLGHGAASEPSSFSAVYSRYVHSVEVAMSFPSDETAGGGSVRADMITGPSQGALPILEAAFQDAQKVRTNLLGKDSRVGSQEGGASVFVPEGSGYFERVIQAKDSRQQLVALAAVAPSLFGAKTSTAVQQELAGEAFGLSAKGSRPSHEGAADGKTDQGSNGECSLCFVLSMCRTCWPMCKAWSWTHKTWPEMPSMLADVRSMGLDPQDLA